MGSRFEFEFVKDEGMTDSAPALSDHAPFELAAPKVPPALTSASLADEAETAIFETFVAPGYLAPFAEMALSMIDPNVGGASGGGGARIAHMLCRTGFPDRELASRLPGARIHGFDPSRYAVELANVKAASAFDLVAEYVCASSVPTPLPEGVFTHAFMLHPLATPPQRAALYGEALRLLRPGGQLVYAMPVRGSFIEIFDLMREYGLKFESAEVEDYVSRGVELRPTVETFATELELAGFVDVDVELHPNSISFRSARDFFENPATRLLIFPALHVPADGAALAYVKDAISKYWSETDFALTVNVACATARKS